MQIEVISVAFCDVDFSCFSCLGAAILINKPNNPPSGKKLSALLVVHMYIYKNNKQ